MKYILASLVLFLAATPVLAVDPIFIETAEAGLYHAAAPKDAFTFVQLVAASLATAAVGGFCLIRFLVREQELIERSSFGSRDA